MALPVAKGRLCVRREAHRDFIGHRTKTFETQAFISLINFHTRDKDKRKVFPLQARLWSRRWVEVYFYSCMTSALEGGEWSAARPGRTLSPGKTRYPLYRRLGGPQGRFGRVENLAPTGIRSHTRCRTPLMRGQSIARPLPVCTISTLPGVRSPEEEANVQPHS